MSLGGEQDRKRRYSSDEQDQPRRKKAMDEIANCHRRLQRLGYAMRSVEVYSVEKRGRHVTQPRIELAEDNPPKLLPLMQSQAELPVEPLGAMSPLALNEPAPVPAPPYRPLSTTERVSIQLLAAGAAQEETTSDIQKLRTPAQRDVDVDVSPDDQKAILDSQISPRPHNSQPPTDGSGSSVDKESGSSGQEENRSVLPYKCVHCTSTFGSGKELSDHLSIHGVTAECKCEVCGVGFRYNFELNRHRADIHQVSRAFHCDLCDKKFERNADLSKHIELVHKKTKRYRCPDPTCGKYFGLKVGATRHYDTVHLKQRNYLCKVCGLGFGTNSNLSKHVRRKHPDRMSPERRLGYSFTERIKKEL